MGPPPPLLPLRPSHIADNDIGAEGCIALSSSLVHLSHLEKLYLRGKCFRIQRVVVLALLSAEFACVALSRACIMRFDFHALSFDFDFEVFYFLFVFLVGAATAAPPSPSLTHCR